MTNSDLRAELVETARALNKALEVIERFGKRAAAAEAREDAMVDALLKYWVGCRECASWLRTCNQSGSLRGCDVCRPLSKALANYDGARERAE